MFTRRDTPTNKPQTGPQTDLEPTVPAARLSEASAPAPAPAAPQAPEAVAPPVTRSGADSVSLIAAGDVFEGTLTTTNGVRVLGTVRGTIESKSNVQIDGDALVEADITAENVTIAGTYKGTLDCNGRLEVTSTGRASGELQTGRILLHEGGFFEGTLHMKPEQPAASAGSGGESSRRRYGQG